MAIPKIIHYCWFGRGEKPKLTQKCIESWKKYCPDYEIIEWNEDNFDINMNPYTKMCYETRKFAFLTDYVRLLVIKEHGGVYMDTDVEMVRSFDGLLKNKAYIGFETDDYVNTGQGFGSEANNPVLDVMIAKYDDLLDGEHGTIGCPILNTEALVDCGLQRNGKPQRLENITVYPADVFNPYDDPTGVLTRTNHTCSIHWYGKTWMDKKVVLKSKLMKPVHRLMGKIKR